MDTALGRTVCPGQQSTTVIEIHDHYAAENGTWWLLCENVGQPKSVPISITSFLNSMSIVVVYGEKPAMDMVSANISVNVKPGWYHIVSYIILLALVYKTIEIEALVARETFIFFTS